MRINKKLVKPMVEQEWNGKEYVDMRFLPLGILLSVGAIILAILISLIAYDVGKWLLRKPGPPPKVVTKIIKQNALSAEQDKYIADCERNTNQSGDHYYQAVPDIHTSTWTCKMP